MLPLTERRIAELLEPYLIDASREIAVPPPLYGSLAAYLELLVRWNERTNLTAIREPEHIVRRHFGESLFAGHQLARAQPSVQTILDLGSGAGFPGVPIQLLLSHTRVTLAESQGKKAAFLREVVRVLGLTAEVWAGRVEDLDAGRHFDAVTLRAVDRMAAMTRVGLERLHPGGTLLRLTTQPEEGAEQMVVPETEGVFVELRRV